MIGNRFAFILAASIAALVVSNSTIANAAEKRYVVGTLAEGTTPFLISTAWANAVNRHYPGHKVQVSAVGAGTRHMLLVAQRKMDFCLWGPTPYNLLYRQIGPFRKIKNGPEMTTKLSMLFSFQIGIYHAVVYDSSGIKSYGDIKGKKVFLGPPAGVATRNMRLIVEAMTGYLPGKDYQQIKLGWGAAQQAFQDRKFDVWITVTATPSPAVSQLALTNKIRMLGLDRSKFNHPSWKKYFRQPGRVLADIDPKDYGRNMVNTEPVPTTGAWVGLGVRSDMPEETVYRMMKAFWDNIGEAHAMAKQMEGLLSLKNAVTALAGDTHPGALRYYKEKGIEIGQPFRLTQADLKPRKK